MSFKGIDLNLVAVLDALFEEGTVTGAARRLKVSQPTVSYALGKLRNHFNDELFVRREGAMRPTRFGQTLREPVREVLVILHRDVTPKAHFMASETTREFILCTSDIGELCFLPMLIEAICERAPHATLRSVSASVEGVKKALLTGAVDVAVGYFPDLAANEIKSQHLFDHPFVCIAREDHPYLSETIDLETFQRCLHAVVRHEGRSQEIAEQAIDVIGLDRRIFLQSPHFVSLPFLLAGSDLVSIVPRSLATAFEQVMRLKSTTPPIDIPDIPLCQHWASRSVSDPAVVWLVALVEELFLGRDPT